MKILKRVLGIITVVGLALAMTSCCHWKNCNAKANNDGMGEMGMNANLLHRPPLAYPPTNCCSDELIADGSFEYESSSPSLHDSYVGLAAVQPLGKDWTIAYTPPPTVDLGHPATVAIFQNGYSKDNRLLHQTPCGDMCVYLGFPGGTNDPNASGNAGPYPSNVLSQTIYSQLKAGKKYDLCFLQSAFDYVDNSGQPQYTTIYGEVAVELDNALNVAVFKGDWQVKPRSDWTMQKTNIMVPADGWYTIKLISCSRTNVALIDGISLRGPH